MKHQGHHGESERHALQARGQKTGIGTQLKQLQTIQKDIENQRLRLLEKYIIKNIPWVTKDMVHIDAYKDNTFRIMIYKSSDEMLFKVNIPNKDFPDKEEIYYNTMEDDIRESVHERTGDAVDEFLHKKIGNKLFSTFFIQGNEDMYDYIEEKYPKEWKKIKKQIDKDVTQRFLDEPSDYAIEAYHDYFYKTVQNATNFKQITISPEHNWDEYKGYKSVYVHSIEMQIKDNNINKIIKELKTIKPLL